MNATGYGIIQGPGATKQFDTVRCNHCGKHFCMASDSPDATPDPGGFCRICMDNLCGKCAGIAPTQGCTPFLRKIEEQEARARRLEAIGV